MKNKFLEIRKNIKKPKFLEKFFLRINWLFFFYATFQVIKNALYLSRIKPNMLEMEILPLMFFFQVSYFNIIALIMCSGFLLLYYRSKKEVKDNADK